MTNAIEHGELINLTRVAEILGVTRPTVYEYIGKGMLPEPERVGGLPYLRKQDVEEFKRTRKEA